MRIHGTLIAESLQAGAVLEGVPLAVTKVSRAECGDEQSGQPRTWTFIDFEAPSPAADLLSHVLCEALDPSLGWYCDFRSTEETFVVFSGRIFRYRRGDRRARAGAEVYARLLGVPEAQLDWPE
jgi:hypothetical protein